MSCNMRSEDYPYIVTIGSSAVKHACFKSKSGSLFTACKKAVYSTDRHDIER